MATISRKLKKAQQPVCIVVHGGAGCIHKKHKSLEDEYLETLAKALKAGHQLLREAENAVEAVTEAVEILENSPLFNAGKGSVYTHNETHELDAAIMEGQRLQAGSVAGISTIKNPIRLARKVMEASKHVMLIGRGAELFGQIQGVEQVDNSYFDTAERLQQIKSIKMNDANVIASSEADDYFKTLSQRLDDRKFGTVGAVAMDQYGNLAAATSTGGVTNKRYGRVGDSPIIGAGTYADNSTCAVSATGEGESFIRCTVARDIAALMEYKGLSVEHAVHEVVHKKLIDHGGEGGIIAVDRNGQIAMDFNTSGMYRGSIDVQGNLQVALYA